MYPLAEMRANKKFHFSGKVWKQGKMSRSWEKVGPVALDLITKQKSTKNNSSKGSFMQFRGRVKTAAATSVVRCEQIATDEHG
jgi:hypothetical protein